VVRRLSQVPDHADFLLVPSRQADSPEHRQRLIDTLGFPHQILRFTDALHNDFTLWSRTPPPDEAPETAEPASTNVRIHPSAKPNP
jgi:hypothetical protein